MHFDLFINFDGNCKEAVEFYAKTFRSEVKDMMLYGESPPDPSYQMAEADKGRVMYCSVPIAGLDVMFCDIPGEMELIKGNNISPTLSIEDKPELDRLFHALAEGGTVDMDLQKNLLERVVRHGDGQIRHHLAADALETGSITSPRAALRPKMGRRGTRAFSTAFFVGLCNNRGGVCQLGNH